MPEEEDHGKDARKGFAHNLLGQQFGYGQCEGEEQKEVANTQEVFNFFFSLMYYYLLNLNEPYPAQNWEKEPPQTGLCCQSWKQQTAQRWWITSRKMLTARLPAL